MKTYNMALLRNLIGYSDRYEISIQFWPDQSAVYIAKDGVELTDFGGDGDDVFLRAINYLNRITSQTNGNSAGGR